MPPQVYHPFGASFQAWYDGGTWLSCEPSTIWKRYLGHSSLKRKFSHSYAVNLRSWYLRANTKRAFPWLLLRSGRFFRLKRFHAFRHMPPHCCCRSRQTFVLQLFAEFSCRISSFICCFFYNFLCGSVKNWWSTTSLLVVKLLWTWPLRYPALAFLQYFSRF